MKIARRRKRSVDSFASPEWVRSILEQLKTDSPIIDQLKEKDIIKFARAVRHVERYAATDTRRGRPSRWRREDLIRTGSKLTEILGRETQGKISSATFIDHYLRLLSFPADVIEALASGKINLFEAEQLARVNARRLETGDSESKRKRAELLRTHIQTKASGERLRRRINDLLGSKQSEGISLLSDDYTETAKDMENFDPYDSAHLFWEEIKQLGFAFREIRREDMTDELIEELLEASQPVWAVLTKIRRRRQSHVREADR